MPTYEWKCDQCGHTEEHTGKFEDIGKMQIKCPTCNPPGIISRGSVPVFLRRLITGGSGFILNGPAKDWPSKAGRLQGADKTIQRQRRKACVLKDRGEAPQSAILGLKESDRLYDNKHTEGELDKLYKDSVEGK